MIVAAGRAATLPFRAKIGHTPRGFRAGLLIDLLGHEPHFAAERILGDSGPYQFRNGVSDIECIEALDPFAAIALLGIEEKLDRGQVLGVFVHLEDFVDAFAELTDPRVRAPLARRCSCWSSPGWRCPFLHPCRSSSAACAFGACMPKTAGRRSYSTTVSGAWGVRKGAGGMNCRLGTLARCTQNATWGHKPERIPDFGFQIPKRNSRCAGLVSAA